MFNYFRQLFAKKAPLIRTETLPDFYTVVKHSMLEEPAAVMFDHSKPAQKKSVFISAGHDNSRRGAFGNGYSEHDIVLAFRNDLADELVRRGLDFEMDGEGDVNLPLRAAVAEARNHDIAIEFHCNASASPSATGSEILSAKPESEFNRAMAEVTAKTIGIRNRGSKPEDSGQHSRLAFISDGGGIIVELFFLSNRDDLDRFFAHREELIVAYGELIEQAVRV